MASDLIRRLRQPPREYTPMPFWFLNDDLEEEEIRRQLRDFDAHGVHGVVLHPRMGLSERIGYLSETFFSYIGAALEEASALGMRVALYDEGMYPSGSAGGLVTKLHPEWASRGLGLVPAPRAGDTVLLETDRGFLVECFSGGTIRGTHFGEDDGEPRAPVSADILNPKAVACFLELTHEQYARRFSRYFGNTVIGFFTDEPSILGRNTRGLFPWSEGFREVFEAAGGRLEGLTGLFAGEENPDTEIYHREILLREEKVYYAALSRWCADHGLALMGHPAESDDLELEKYFQLPGQDLVFRMVAPEKGDLSGRNSTLGKCSADAARLTGSRRNSNECFGACGMPGNPWEYTGGDMKWMIDYLTVRGVNLLIPHAFYYSLRGARSDERPPDVGPGSLWWPYYGKWAEYMTRLCCLRTETETVLDTAVPCRNGDLCPERVAPLFESQRGFQYLPESRWDRCREENGRLICGDMVFGAVAGPEICWPSVPHGPEAGARDCLCDPPCPDLRSARLRKDGQELWLLVNAGQKALRTELTLPSHDRIGAMDLWNNRLRRCDAAEGDAGRKLPVSLAPFESLLLFTCGEKDWQDLPEEGPSRLLDPSVFRLTEEDPSRWRKVYTAEVPACGQDLLVEFRGAESGVLYADGEPADAAFWPYQLMRIPAAGRTGGTLSLRLEVTGNLANRYGKPVPYGLWESAGETGKKTD